jgi:hypothetical protein
VIRLRWPRRRKPASEMTIAAPAFESALHDLYHLLDTSGIRHQHVIERKIPRPTTITFAVYTPEGQRFVLPPMDVSFKSTFPVRFPLAWITGSPSDAQQIGIGAELHYDPRDQR